MKDIFIIASFFAGSVFILIAALGLLRFRDTLSRMHATTKATSFGLLLILVGVGLFYASALAWIKAIVILIFIYLTAPLAAHSISKTLDTGSRK